ncbi:MAG: F0F1 ATP synthase subunit epsilon [Firmicutes bacterium]|mgnify:CR=1 FL=1|jgi:F-type H+-transporting ATPase subunit epsilon|nr:F0F1 ATP synthase subunit epsilon [Bacillota bacterium]
MAAFRFEVVTPERTVVQQEVEYVSLPGTDGEFGILANHAPLAAVLEIGVVEFGSRQGEREFLALGGGFAEMHGNALTVMGNSAELSYEIDVERAKAAKARAEQRLRERSEAVDFARAEAALRRALARLKAAGGNNRK